jgi:ABC-2 type transport system permease protein
MRKTLFIWWQTYTRSVLHPAFLMFTVGLPLAAVVLGGLTAYFILKAQEGDRRAIGIVDRSGALAPAIGWRPSDGAGKAVEMRAYANEAEAEQALQAGGIQAFYVVAPDYVDSGSVTEVSAGGVANRVRDQVQAYLKEGLLQATSLERRARITQGTTLLHRSLADQRELTLQLGLQWGVAAFVLAAFYFINTASSSDMLYALREEEEQGTIEIALTSVRVPELLAGKVMGVVSAGLTQFIAWAAGASVLAFIGLQVLGMGRLDVSLEPVGATLALCLALLLPAYVMNATGVVIVSALTDLAGRGEQVVGLAMNFAGVLTGPLTFIAITAPDNSLSIVLSLLPITSPMVMVTRFVQVAVPAWQVAVSIALVWSTMLFNIFLAARIYRARWLMSGQKHWLRAARLALTEK